MTYELPQPDLYDAAEDVECYSVELLSAAYKAGAEQHEPVARIRCWLKNGDRHAELVDWQFPGIEELGEGDHMLYSAPQARQPLTDEQIDELLVDHLVGVRGFHQFARAIEAAHGIKGGTQ